MKRHLGLLVAAAVLALSACSEEGGTPASDDGLPSDAGDLAPGDLPDSALPDEAGRDLPLPDEGGPEVPTDVPADVPPEIPVDVPADILADAPLEVAADTPVDVPSDPLQDVPGEVPVDVPQDGPAGDTDLPPFADGARAFVAASSDQLIGGVQAAGVPGDIVLQNTHVRFVVRNQQRSLLSPYGGALVDADLARPEGEPGNDRFFEVFPMTGFGRVFKANRMDIVDDGTVSGTAVVRFTGVDGGMSLIDSLLPTTPYYLEVTTDYILAPGASHLEVATTVKNAGGWTDPIDIGQFLQLGNRLNLFHDRCGRDEDCLASRSDVRWMAGAAGGVSYGFTIPGPDTLAMLLAVQELAVLKSGSFTLATDEAVTVRQFLAVGHGTIDEVVSTMKSLRGEAPGLEVQVNVTLGDPRSLLESAWVGVRHAEGGADTDWVTATSPGEDGKAVVHLEPGAYDFILSLPGTPDTVAKGVVIEDGKANSVDLAAPGAGWLHVRITDSAEHPVTGALTLQAGSDAPWLQGVARYEAIRGGDRTIAVLPGDYTATLARGLVWSIDRKNVTVAAGAVTELVGRIDPAVDTTGFLMLNSHEHCERSIDSTVPVEDRVYNAIANGIDIMNPTDHDYFGSHQGTIEALGVGDQVMSFLGCEVSPLWGHSTASGCRLPPAYPTYYAVDFTVYDEDGGAVRGLSATEIYQQSREVFGCEFVAVNHPYRGQATFDTYGVTSTSDPADAEPDLDLHLVDAMEVYNKTDDLDTILSKNLPAWFNLLNRGYPVAAIGGSDEHGYNGNYGNPRNMVPSEKGVAEGVGSSDIFGAMKSFRHVVLGGPVIRLTVNGETLGSTVSAPGGTVNVHVVVEAPAWMGLSFVKVFANGEVAREFQPLQTTERTRLDGAFDLELLTDAHVVVVAGSLLPEHEMIPVSSKNPLSVTNPVFVDVDGNGFKGILAD